MASRDWDSNTPNLPRSTAENPKLAYNDYYTRDFMHAVGPPTVIVDATKNEKKDDQKVSDNEGVNTLADVEETQNRKTPGKVYEYSGIKSSDPAM